MPYAAVSRVTLPGEWSVPQVLPEEEITISPFANGYQYGQLVFEGLKFTVSETGRILLFREGLNLRRINASAEAMGLPTVDLNLFMDAIKMAILANKDTYTTGYYYVRPCIANTSKVLSPGAGDDYIFCVGLAPIDFHGDPMKVFVTEARARTFTGGVGFAKASGNYGNVIAYERQMKAEGYASVLYLDASMRQFIEEVGTMTPFFVSGTTLITPAFTDTVIESTTRETIKVIAEELGYKYDQKMITIRDLTMLHTSGKLHEAFGVGTASNIVPWSAFHFRNKDYVLPNCDKQNNVAATFLNRLVELHYGARPEFVTEISE